jgi:hypothetical protein
MSQRMSAPHRNDSQWGSVFVGLVLRFDSLVSFPKSWVKVLRTHALLPHRLQVLPSRLVRTALPPPLTPAWASGSVPLQGSIEQGR